MVEDSKMKRRVPAEWELQEQVWLSWPHQQETWPGHYEPIPAFYLRWIDSLRESMSVKLLAGDPIIGDCENQIQGRSGVDVIRIETNDCWIRDYGPTFVQTDSPNPLMGVDWKYNSWGGKYPPWEADNLVASRICSELDIPCTQSQLCVEGGAMEFDGLGRMLSTSSCLLSPNRNPDWSRIQIEEEMERLLGIHEIMWLDGGGLCGDDTDGHIDQLARFIDPENVVVATTDDRCDANYPALDLNFRLMQAWGEETSPRVTIHRLPTPPARFVDGKRVPESYCNFLRLGSERLLVPSFGASSDEYARALLTELTNITVEMIDCRDMVWGLGALHCASRDQPA